MTSWIKLLQISKWIERNRLCEQFSPILHSKVLSQNGWKSFRCECGLNFHRQRDKISNSKFEIKNRLVFAQIRNLRKEISEAQNKMPKILNKKRNLHPSFSVKSKQLVQQTVRFPADCALLFGVSALADARLVGHYAVSYECRIIQTFEIQTLNFPRLFRRFKGTKQMPDDTSG